MRTLLSVTLLALTACTAMPRRGDVNPPSDAKAERLYRAKCAACHRLRDPEERSRDEWARAVERHGPQAHLSPGESALLLAWLQSQTVN